MLENNVFKMYNLYAFLYFNISEYKSNNSPQYYWFYIIFDQTNAAFVSTKLLSKIFLFSLNLFPL